MDLVFSLKAQKSGDNIRILDGHYQWYFSLRQKWIRYHISINIDGEQMCTYFAHPVPWISSCRFMNMGRPD